MRRAAVLLALMMIFSQTAYALYADSPYTSADNAYWKNLIESEGEMLCSRFLYGTYQLTAEQTAVSDSYKQFFIQNLIRTPLKDYWSIADAARELEPMQILFVSKVNGGIGVASGDKMAIQFTDNGSGGNLTISKYKSIASHEMTHSLTWGIVDEKFFILTEGCAVYVESEICKAAGLNFTMQSDHIQAMKQVGSLERIIGAKTFWTLTREDNGGRKIAALFEEKQNVISWTRYKTAGNEAFGNAEAMDKLTQYMAYIEGHPVFNPNDSKHVEIRAFAGEDGVSMKFMKSLKKAVQIGKDVI